MYVKTFAGAVFGINATIITVEVDVSTGLNFYMVGLPDNAVKESQQRVESALRINGYSLPGKKIVINLAPADLRNEGSAYDLSIAMGILGASGQIGNELLGQYIILGELSLDGKIQPMRGALPIAIQARKEGFKGMIVPKANARDAAVVNDVYINGVEKI